jgi:hypothetical protein
MDANARQWGEFLQKGTKGKKGKLIGVGISFVYFVAFVKRTTKTKRWVEQFCNPAGK